MSSTLEVPCLFDISVRADNWFAITKEARKRGWGYLDCGLRAQVYSLGNRVMKMFFDDIAYLRYITEVITPNNRSYPQIEDIIIGDNLTIVFMEKLEYLGEDSWIIFPIRDALKSGISQPEMIERYLLEEHRVRLGNDGVSAIYAICKFIRDNHYYPDLQYDNIMKRPGTNEIVFLDPVVG